MSAGTGTFALVGPGRAGLAVARGLTRAGWRAVAVAGRSSTSAGVRAAAEELAAAPRDVPEVAVGAELVLLGCPDEALPDVAARLSASPETLVVHLSGVHGLGVLGALPCRVGALHPLMTIPTPDPDRLAGAWCGVAGDAACAQLARTLGMQPVTVPDDQRPRYHAAATIASNHLVGLLATVGRIAPVPLEAYLPLVRATVENVAVAGAAGALTGPVARGDLGTVRAHLAALAPEDRLAYLALAAELARLSGRSGPEWEALLGAEASP